MSISERHERGILQPRGITAEQAERYGVASIINMAQARVWPSDPRYMACPDGTVLGPDGCPVRGWTGKKQRRHILIDGKQVLVAWIVCEAFHGPRPKGMQAAHEDGNSLNDAADNLAWKTVRDNAIDRFRHGTMRNKLQVADVVEIRRRRSEGEQLQSIADDYGVTKQTIHHIALRKTWGHL